MPLKRKRLDLEVANMTQGDMKVQFEEMVSQNYEFFIKALIDLELSISDPLKLDMLYQEYMGQDEMDLLNPYFRHISE